MSAPGIDPAPDVSDEALQALRGDALYCNVAGSGPTFPVAQDAAERFRRWLNAVGMFGHEGYDAYNAALAAAREDLAEFVGDPGGASRIALLQSATEALNVAIAGLELDPGTTIVTTDEEHGSALLPILARAPQGIAAHVVPADDVREALRPGRLPRGARALVVSLVSCKTGKRLPAEDAVALARDAGLVTIVDAAQAAGQVPVDVRGLGADAVALLGHKWLHGPLATGALWVRDPATFVPRRLGWRSSVGHDLAGRIDLQPDATRFETGTVDAPAFVGLRQALAVHHALGTRVARRIRTLRDRLFDALVELPFDLRSRREDPTGIVSVTPRHGDAAGIVARVWSDDRVVIKLLEEKGAPDGIRLSFWALHREADIDRLAASLARHARVPA
ncbi:MAG TPA: aminotransferase class V-fold PLP-dependent enzyme [Candidatus Limnocylindria bacterium]|nr:aminotransferase class V-fold PLP-dependent enzyme [Candidatus Limnocylindria bacterium]